MAAQARPGSVVAFWDVRELAFGLVESEEKQRVRLLLSGGREERISPSRLVAEIAAPAGGALDKADERRRARERLLAVEERVRASAAAVEVGPLWEILCEDRAEEPVGTAELSELALGSSHGDAQVALMLALLADGLHFVRRGEDWVPRSRRAVAELQLERERIRRREVETKEFLGHLAETAQGPPYRRRGTEVEKRFLDALEQLAIHEEAAPDAARELALAAIAASGTRFDRPHEGAFRLLRRLGRFASDDENLQVLRFGLRTEFATEVLVHAEESARRGFDRAGRRDLTGLEIVTIDGPYTSEIDDGLSLEALGEGRFRLGIHIADPAAFVERDDPVDREALARALTYYMPDMRLPMLPAAISEQAASLLPGEERPALSFFIDLDPSGEVAAYEIVRSVVRSSARLDYDQADASMVGGAGPHASVMQSLAAVASQRIEARVQRGALQIMAPEVEPHVAPDGSITLQRLSCDSPSRSAVAEAMVLAGEVGARFCIKERLPLIYRRQAISERLPDLSQGIVRDPVAARRLLRTLKRAEASLEPGPHGSLGLPAYAQMTSPIRRYQDLAAHRQIAARLRGEPGFYAPEALQRILATTEQGEADARRAERAADDYWLLRYLEGERGRELEARVLEVQPRPVIQLVDTLREQPMNGLSGVQAGQLVRVRVERVNPRAGILSLRLVG